MVSQILKKSSLLAIALISVFSLSAKHHSHDIQVLINQADANFNYTLNNGDGIECCNILLPRTNGGYYYLNGYIYPKGTVNPKNQSNFALDRHGNALTAENSFGQFHCVANLLQNVTFDVNFPVEGTLLEDIRWDFYFYNDCDGHEGHHGVNNIIAFGKLLAGVLQANQVIFSGEGMPARATECNEHYNYIETAKVYWNGNVDAPQFLIKIRFRDKIFFNGKLSEQA